MFKSPTSRLFLLIFFLSVGTSYGQSNLNYGLDSPQPEETLPKSGAPVIAVQRLPKQNLSTQLVPVLPGEYKITRGWELIERSKVEENEIEIFNEKADRQKWFNATVPGTVLTTLVDQGVYPDPFFGINNVKITDSLCRKEWWYRVSFPIPEESKGKKVWIVFEGINYEAEIWLNGTILGKLKGAFKKGEFNATDFLNPKGANILAVRILPPPNPGIPHEQSYSAGRGPNGGSLSMDGPTFIASEGWDWIPGIKDRNIGIWQDVKLRFTGSGTILDPHVVTDLPLPDISHANISIKADIFNSTKKEANYSVEAVIEDIFVIQKIKVGAGQRVTVSFTPELFKQLRMKKPRLWWPNGYGSPELYDLELSVKEKGGLSDYRLIRFGVRELSYETTVDAFTRKGNRIELNPIDAYQSGKPILDNVNRKEIQPDVFIPKLKVGIETALVKNIEDDGAGPYLVIKVNGKKIFCKGGNWGMDDGMKRISRDRIGPFLRLHKEANYNMVRNWAGQSTTEDFYSLCDEYGIMVWNDFWLSTEGYNLEPSDKALTLDNAKDIIIRYRNHPSIVIWCPRNEGYAPKGLEEPFSELVIKEDGTRLYQGNSRSLNLRPSGPWHFIKNPVQYFTSEARGFNTQIGTLSVPIASTMKKFLAKEDYWPINDAWYYHDFHDEYNQEDYVNIIDSLYGKTADLDDFCKKAQLVNYNSHRAIFEAWNSRLWKDGTGVLLWMSHPAWPSMIWQSYSFDYQTHGSYFGAKKGCEPIHVQMNLNDNKIIVVNTSLKDHSGSKVDCEVYDLKGQKLFNKSQNVDIRANKITETFVPAIPKVSEIYVIRLILTDAKGTVLSINEYLNTGGKDFKALNRVPQADLSGSALRINTATNQIAFQLDNTSVSVALGVKLKLVDKATNAEILPAYFSDGYFNLFSGETREFTVEYPGPARAGLKIVAEGYNVAGVVNID